MNQAPSSSLQQSPPSRSSNDHSGPGGPDKTPAKSLREQSAELAPGVQCRCDLDNWEPEASTGHSWVCPIHKAVTAKRAAECLERPQLITEQVRPFDPEAKGGIVDQARTLRDRAGALLGGKVNRPTTAETIGKNPAACSNAMHTDVAAAAASETCDGCDGSGIHVYDSPGLRGHSGPVPEGYVVIERCDTCAIHDGDLEAALVYAGERADIEGEVIDRERDTIARRKSETSPSAASAERPGQDRASASMPGVNTHGRDGERCHTAPAGCGAQLETGGHMKSEPKRAESQPGTSTPSDGDLDPVVAKLEAKFRGEARHTLDGLLDLLDELPELNPSNYDHDDACDLNAKATEACLYARELRKELKAIGVISPETAELVRVLRQLLPLVTGTNSAADQMRKTIRGFINSLEFGGVVKPAAPKALLDAVRYAAEFEVPGINDPNVDDADDVDINVTIGWLRECRDAVASAEQDIEAFATFVREILGAVAYARGAEPRTLLSKVQAALDKLLRTNPTPPTDPHSAKDARASTQGPQGSRPATSSRERLMITPEQAASLPENVDRSRFVVTCPCCGDELDFYTGNRREPDNNVPAVAPGWYCGDGFGVSHGVINNPNASTLPLVMGGQGRPDYTPATTTPGSKPAA